MICIFPQNSFQRISVILGLLVTDVLKIVCLLYNRIILCNRIILHNRTSSMALFIFTSVTLWISDIIYFRRALKTLDIGRFSWWMCCKNWIWTKVLSKSFKTLHMPRNKTVAQKSARDLHKSDALAQTNQIKYDCFFCMAQKT